MNSHPASLLPDYCIELSVKSRPLAANFAFYSNRRSATCFVQDQIRSSFVTWINSHHFSWPTGMG